MSLQYRADIDGLRAVAVLSVVAFHAFPALLPGGFIGVDVFFVISGFLISNIIFSSLANEEFSFCDFYSRRIRRIFPALIIVLISCFALGWFVLSAIDFKMLGRHIVGGSTFLSNLLLWREIGYFNEAAETKPLLHLWSLGIEEQFYIVWPLLFSVAWKYKVSFLRITVTLTVISFLWSLRETHVNVTAAFYSPLTRFWELGIGGILASSIRKRNIGSSYPNFYSVLGFALIAIALFSIDKTKSFPGIWALLPTLGAFLIISAGPFAWLNRVILSHRILVWVGLISFPLYLWHWPLLSIFRISESEPLTLMQRLIIVLMSLLFSWGTYLWIEKPLRFKNREKYKVKLLCLAMGIVGVIGFITYAKDGFKFRLADEILRYIAIQPEISQEWRPHQCFLEEKDHDSQFGKECI